MFEETQLWLGTQASFDIVLAAYSQAIQMLVASNSKDEYGPSMLSVSDGVGVVSIRGPLVSGSAGFMRYFGVTGYNDIRDALVQAVNDPSVESILLDINSPGGSVAGVADTSSFIRQVNALKPVTTYADGSLASGAYWLGSSANQIVISPTTIAGSIGVIMTHTEASKARADAGLKDTVIRAGEFKALGSPYEPLSAKAQKAFQAQADEIYKVFLTHAADSRGLSYSNADSKIGQGREFVGQSAVDVGMVDKVGSFEQAMGMAKVMKPVDKKKNSLQNSRVQGASMSKATLTAEQIAQIQSGGSLETNSESVLELTPEQKAEADRVAAEVAAAATAAETAAAETAAAAAAQAAAASAATPDVLTILRAELKTAHEANGAAQVELQAARAETAAMKESFDGLLSIARTSLGKLHIALRSGTLESASAMAAKDLVPEHKRVQAIFDKKFVAGGLANSSVEDVEKKDTVTEVKRPTLLRALVPAVKSA